MPMADKLCKTLKQIARKLKKKPIDTGNQNYEEYEERKNQKIDYERDRAPHW